MEAYAVIETGGKQYRVQSGSVLDVEKLDGNVGDKITLNNVLALSDGTTLTIGVPAVKGASIAAEVVEQFRGDKVIAFRKKKRKGYHKKRGHRQSLTKIKIAAITK